MEDLTQLTGEELGQRIMQARLILSRLREEFVRRAQEAKCPAPASETSGAGE